MPVIKSSALVNIQVTKRRRWWMQKRPDFPHPLSVPYPPVIASAFRRRAQAGPHGVILPLDVPIASAGRLCDDGTRDRDIPALRLFENAEMAVVQSRREGGLMLERPCGTK
jgi:hypothetical protein